MSSAANAKGPVGPAISTAGSGGGLSLTRPWDQRTLPPHDEKNFGTCCCQCFTLRRGVLYFAWYMTAISVLMLLGAVTDDFRFLIGGYVWYTRYLVAFVGLGG